MESISQKIYERKQLINAFINEQKNDDNPVWQDLINICKKQLKILK